MTANNWQDEIERANRPTPWDLINKVLYDFCSQYPTHNGIDQIVAKLVLIGRTYSAALERRRNAREPVDEFYASVAAPRISDSGIDEWIRDISSFTEPNEENLESIVGVHKRVTDLFCDISGLKKRSLASKYLHFHQPALFFIFDSRVYGAAGRAARRLELRIHQSSRPEIFADRDYLLFFNRCLALLDKIRQKTDISLDPRRLDNLLLNVSEP